jgi:hypothetical protein
VQGSITMGVKEFTMVVKAFTMKPMTPIFAKVSQD